MIVLLAVGQQARIDWNLLHQIETMTAFVAATGAGDIPTGSIEYKTIFAVGLTLFVLTFAMNIVSIRLVRKYREECTNERGPVAADRAAAFRGQLTGGSSRRSSSSRCSSGS